MRRFYLSCCLFAANFSLTLTVKKTVVEINSGQGYLFAGNYNQVWLAGGKTPTNMYVISTGFICGFRVALFQRMAPVCSHAVCSLIGTMASRKWVLNLGEGGRVGSFRGSGFEVHDPPGFVEDQHFEAQVMGTALLLFSLPSDGLLGAKQEFQGKKHAKGEDQEEGVHEGRRRRYIASRRANMVASERGMLPRVHSVRFLSQLS